MATTVIVNNLSIVHKDSGGVSVAFPDVCKTPSPGGPVPIPYPNTAVSQDTSNGSQTVKADGNPFMLKSSCFAKSTGDEPGSAGGVVSGKIKGKAYPKSYSFDVKVEGENVFRFTDLMLQNGGSPVNTGPASEMQPNQPGAAAAAAQNKLPEITSLKWDKSEVCCGDEVALEVQTKDAPDQKLLVRVYREGEKPLHDMLGAELHGNNGKALWEVRRGAWLKEVKVAARHKNVGGKQVESGALVVTAPAGTPHETHFEAKRIVPKFKKLPTGAWVKDLTAPPWGWEVCYDIEYSEKKPGRLTVTGRIDLELQPGAQKPGPATLRKWKKSIEDVWSRKWKLHRADCKRGDPCGCGSKNGCCQFLVRIQCVFGPSPGKKVKLFPGACDPHGTNGKWWYSHTWWWDEQYVINPATVRAHEFGHIIGMYDEYEEGAIDPSCLYAKVPDSIMYGGTKVYDRHMKAFNAWFDKQFKTVIGNTELLPCT
jgi:hypothetical protein